MYPHTNLYTTLIIYIYIQQHINPPIQGKTVRSQVPTKALQDDSFTGGRLLKMGDPKTYGFQYMVIHDFDDLGYPYLRKPPFCIHQVSK